MMRPHKLIVLQFVLLIGIGCQAQQVNHDNQVDRRHIETISSAYFGKFLNVMGGPLSSIYSIDTSLSDTRDSLRAAFTSNNVSFVGVIPTVFHKVSLHGYRVLTREHKSHRTIVVGGADAPFLLDVDTTWPSGPVSQDVSTYYDSNLEFLDTALSLAKTVASINELIELEGRKHYSIQEIEGIVKLLFDLRNYLDEDIPLLFLENWYDQLIQMDFTLNYIDESNAADDAESISKAFADAVAVLESIAEKHVSKNLGPVTERKGDVTTVTGHIYYYASGFIARVEFEFSHGHLKLISRSMIGRRTTSISR